MAASSYSLTLAVLTVLLIDGRKQCCGDVTTYPVQKHQEQKKYVNLRTFLKPENWLADKNQLSSCLKY